MNHLLKMAANVAFLCHFCQKKNHVGMPWHAESMLRKPQVHWHGVEAGNRSKFAGDMHSHMSQLGRAAKDAK